MKVLGNPRVVVSHSKQNKLHIQQKTDKILANITIIKVRWFDFRIYKN